MTASGRKDVTSRYGSLATVLLYAFILITSNLAHTESFEVIASSHDLPALNESEGSKTPGHCKFEEDPNLCPVCIFQAMGMLKPVVLDSLEFQLSPQAVVEFRMPGIFESCLVEETRARSPPAIS